MIHNDLMIEQLRLSGEKSKFVNEMIDQIALQSHFSNIKFEHSVVEYIYIYKIIWRNGYISKINRISEQSLGKKRKHVFRAQMG